MQTVFVLLNMVLAIAIPLAIQLWDRKRLSPEEREWVWGYASWGSAIYNFGPLSLVAWGYVTRRERYVRGLSYGVLLTAIALFVQAVLCEITGRAMGFRPKKLLEMRVSFVATLVAAALAALFVGIGRTLGWWAAAAVLIAVLVAYCALYPV